MCIEGKSTVGSVLWEYRCDCGNTKIVTTSDLISRKVKSCGCLHKEGSHKTHNMSKTRFYKIWCSIKYRCLNEKSYKYYLYGGRGITVCDRWLKFENFKEDMYSSYLAHVEKYGEKNTSIDRIDVNGNYEPNNCRWATNSEQQANTRRTFIIDGMCLKDFCELNGVNYGTIKSRYKRSGYTLTPDEIKQQVMEMIK